jgi:hypothetical protein
MVGRKGLYDEAVQENDKDMAQFIADMGALEAIFSHRCDSTSYSITVRIPHSCVFGCQ